MAVFNGLRNIIFALVGKMKDGKDWFCLLFEHLFWTLCASMLFFKNCFPRQRATRRRREAVCDLDLRRGRGARSGQVQNHYLQTFFYFMSRREVRQFYHLIPGILLGLDAAGWSDVPLLVMETEGSKCLKLSLEQGRRVVLDDITTIATSLGARWERTWRKLPNEWENSL